MYPIAVGLPFLQAFEYMVTYKSDAEFVAQFTSVVAQGIQKRFARYMQKDFEEIETFGKDNFTKLMASMLGPDMAKFNWNFGYCFSVYGLRSPKLALKLSGLEHIKGIIKVPQLGTIVFRIT